MVGVGLILRGFIRFESWFLVDFFVVFIDTKVLEFFRWV